MSRESQQQLTRLIQEQKPAHTIESVRFGCAGFVIGRNSAVGIDTQFVSAVAPVLGGRSSSDPPGNVHLSRSSILRAGTRRRSRGFRVGVSSTVGVHTVLE